MSHGVLRIFGAVALLGIFVITPGAPVRAATVMVTLSNDTYDDPGCAVTGTGSCSLRDAVAYGNAHPHTAIIFGNPTAAILTIQPTGNDDIRSGDLNITADMSISGTYADTPTRILADGLHDRIFTIDPGANARIFLRNLSLSRGTAPKTLPEGGALLISTGSTVFITGCVFVGNSATSADGADPDIPVKTAYGGAIANMGNLSVSSTAFRQNIAQAGTAIPTSSGASGEDGGDAMGGAIYSTGETGSLGGLHISKSIFEYNSSLASDGGASSATGGEGGRASGGAIDARITYASGTTIDTSYFRYNKAGGGAGGPGAPGSFLLGGTGGNGGYASGGALSVHSDLANLIFDSNVVLPGNGGDGGGISAPGGTGGDGGDGGAALGGTIFIDGGVLANLTIISREVEYGGSAGNGGMGPTYGMTGRLGRMYGKGIDVIQGTVVNSIVIDRMSGGGNQCFGVITNGGHNLEWPDPHSSGSTSCGGGQPFLVADPMFIPGPNLPIPATGSPALDSGGNDTCLSLLVRGVDIRGVTRPFPIGGTCDIGAVEAGLSIDANGITPQNGSVNGGFTVTVHGAGFAEGIAVFVGGSAAVVMLLDDTTITVQMPNYPAPATVPMLIKNADGNVVEARYTYGTPSVVPPLRPPGPPGGVPGPLPPQRPSGPAIGTAPDPQPPPR